MKRRTRLATIWIAALASATLGADCSIFFVAPDDPMLDGDVLELSGLRPANVVPGTRTLLPGPDGVQGTEDDFSVPIEGDVDLVARAGITDFAGGFPPPIDPQSPLPTAVAEPFGQGVPISFVVAPSNGATDEPGGQPTFAPSLVDVPVVAVAFADLDGDGYVGITNLDGDPTDFATEERELTPVGRQLAFSNGSRAAGSLQISAGGPAAAPLRVVIGAVAYAGPFHPDFFNGLVPDGPAVMTRLPFFPRLDPARALDVGGPASPSNRLGVAFEGDLTPDPADLRLREHYTLATDGTDPTLGIAMAESGAFARVGFARAPDPLRYVDLESRPLASGAADDGGRILLEILQHVWLPDDGPATTTALRLVPLDRLGNVTDLPASEVVTVRTTGPVSISQPDADGDPFRESLIVSDARGVELVLDDVGGVFDGPNRGTLIVESSRGQSLARVWLSDPDVDDSGEVTNADRAVVRSARGSDRDDEDFDPTLDLDGDGAITSADVDVARLHRNAPAVPDGF